MRHHPQLRTQLLLPCMLQQISRSIRGCASLHSVAYSALGALCSIQSACYEVLKELHGSHASADGLKSDMMGRWTPAVRVFINFGFRLTPLTLALHDQEAKVGCMRRQLQG